MIVDNSPKEFVFTDYIGNFIEDKLREQRYFHIDDLISEKILHHKNIDELRMVELLCDHYLENINVDDITINKLLDLRDCAILRIQNLERENRMLSYVRTYSQRGSLQGYSHCMQTLLPEDVQLTKEEMNVGYIPQKYEPIEYECGCLTMCYYIPCECYQSIKCEIKLCDDRYCNEKLYPKIERIYMCNRHKVLRQRKDVLDCELITIKKELSSINYFNSLDYKEMHVKMKYLRNKKRISRFPWKNEF